MGISKDNLTAAHVNAVTRTLERYTCEEHSAPLPPEYECVACEVVRDMREAIELIERLDTALRAERRAHKRLSKSLDSAYLSRREVKTWSTK